MLQSLTSFNWRPGATWARWPVRGRWVSKPLSGQRGPGIQLLSPAQPSPARRLSRAFCTQKGQPQRSCIRPLKITEAMRRELTQIGENLRPLSIRPMGTSLGGWGGVENLNLPLAGLQEVDIDNTDKRQQPGLGWMKRQHFKILARPPASLPFPSPL